MGKMRIESKKGKYLGTIDEDTGLDELEEDWEEKLKEAALKKERAQKEKQRRYNEKENNG